MSYVPLFHRQEALGGLGPHLRASKRRTGCQCCRCCEQRTKSKSQSVILYWIQNQPEHEGIECVLWYLASRNLYSIFFLRLYTDYLTLLKTNT